MAIGDQYAEGAFWFTRDGGALWRDLPTMYEFAFRTYGFDVYVDQPPTACYNWVDADGSGSGTLINFDASCSSDYEGIVLYEWDWDNDASYDATGITQSYDFGDTAPHTVGLRVTDTIAQTDIVTDTVQASAGSTDLLTEGFEGSGVPSGWLNVDNDGDTYLWNCSWDLSNHSGSQCASSASYVNYVGPLTPDNLLITPALDLTGYSTVDLSFWTAAQDNSYPSEHFEVWISTTGTDIGDFTDQVIDYTEIDDTWKEHNLGLSGYSGDTIYIAFRHNECTDWYRMNIDDVSVTGS